MGQSQPGPVGPQGPQGDRGDQGPIGIGIQTVTYDAESGNLVFKMTNETSQGPFVVKGSQGERGPQGPQGERGIQGERGPQGATGAQGPAGNIANDASLRSSLTPRTLWCADGDVCVVPDGTRFIRHSGPNLVLGSTQNLNRWILHAPNDDRRSMWLAPGNGSDNWDWSKSVQLLSKGELLVAGRNILAELDDLRARIR